MFALHSRLVVVVVALGTIFASADSAMARPPDPNCGETITANTTLYADLTDCPNEGIVIGADDVTLDLNGHSIDGDAVVAECPPKRSSATWAWPIARATTGSGSLVGRSGSSDSAYSWAPAPIAISSAT